MDTMDRPYHPFCPVSRLESSLTACAALFRALSRLFWESLLSPKWLVKPLPRLKLVIELQSQGIYPIELTPSVFYLVLQVAE